MPTVTQITDTKQFLARVQKLNQLHQYHALINWVQYFVFCFVLFCFVLFCFVLFCFVLFCFVLFCFVLFCFDYLYKLQNTTVTPKVAILLSMDSAWAFSYHQTSQNLNYFGQVSYIFIYFKFYYFFDQIELESYAFALLQYQVNIDVISPLDDFSNYQLIIAPSLYVVPAPLFQSLESFTANGGVLLLSFRYFLLFFIFCFECPFYAIHFFKTLFSFPK
jgi:hypothetical protein